MSAGELFFTDTNLLLYSVDPGDPAKQNAALLWRDLLWERHAGRLSWQVLHEFYVNATRKLKIPNRDARSVVEAFELWGPVDTSHGLIQRAWHWMDHTQIAYWDGLIIAGAERTSCAWLLSEDFQHGRRFGAVTVVNPFRSSPREFGFAEK
ncbi:MAG: PIN domain-containing protein [Bryobacteraceae bacterium]